MSNNSPVNLTDVYFKLAREIVRSLRIEYGSKQPLFIKNYENKTPKDLRIAIHNIKGYSKTRDENIKKLFDSLIEFKNFKFYEDKLEIIDSDNKIIFKEDGFHDKYIENKNLLWFKNCIKLLSQVEKWIVLEKRFIENFIDFDESINLNYYFPNKEVSASLAIFKRKENNIEINLKKPYTHKDKSQNNTASKEYIASSGFKDIKKVIYFDFLEDSKRSSTLKINFPQVEIDNKITHMDGLFTFYSSVKNKYVSIKIILLSSKIVNENIFTSIPTVFSPFNDIKQYLIIDKEIRTILSSFKKNRFDYFDFGKHNINHLGYRDLLNSINEHYKLDKIYDYHSVIGKYELHFNRINKNKSHDSLHIACDFDTGKFFAVLYHYRNSIDIKENSPKRMIGKISFTSSTIDIIFHPEKENSLPFRFMDSIYVCINIGPYENISEYINDRIFFTGVIAGRLDASDTSKSVAAASKLLAVRKNRVCMVGDEIVKEDIHCDQQLLDEKLQTLYDEDLLLGE